jgi:hypothetical protein
MKHKTLITILTAIGLSLSGTAAWPKEPIDNKDKAGVIGPIDNKSKALPGDQNKLLPAVQKPPASAPGMGSPATAQGDLSMDKPGDKPPVKPEKMMSPGMGSAMPARGGISKTIGPDKPDNNPPKPDKKNQITPDSDTSGPEPVKALPMPQGIQNPVKALPMPQGTQGSTPPLGSPKDPSGPEESVPPSSPPR